MASHKFYAKGEMMKKKSLVGWTAKEFFSLTLDYNCYGEAYIENVFRDKKDYYMSNEHDGEKPIKVRITISEIK